MSVCNPCNKTKPVLACTSTLTVGTLSTYPNTSVHVYLKNHTTGGYIERYVVTTTAGGSVQIALTSNQIMPDHNYELWVTLATATNTDERLAITIDGENHTCLQPKFRMVFNTSEALVSGNQTLSLE